MGMSVYHGISILIYWTRLCQFEVSIYFLNLPELRTDRPRWCRNQQSYLQAQNSSKFVYNCGIFMENQLTFVLIGRVS
jgi:hypothetical protein